MRRKRDYRGRQLVFKLGLAGVMAAVLWVAGLFQFASLVPKQVLDPSTRTNAIVVLTGGSRRLGEGLELLSRGLAEKLFVSGVYRGVDVHKLLQIVMRNHRELETRIGIGNATNIQKICRFTSIQFDDIHGRHREPRSIDQATDVPIQFDVRQSRGFGPHFCWFLFVEVTQYDKFRVTEQCIVIESDLGIQKDDPGIFGADHWVDFDHRAVI